MSLLDLEAFRNTPLNREPFEYLIIPGFVTTEGCARINADYPPIQDSGSFPVSQLTYGPAVKELTEEVNGEPFRKAFEEKFKLDLAGAPTTLTFRGRCSSRDGQIHTDSKSKIITVLIYMNSAWEAGGGRLRLLRGENDLEDMVAEVPPVEGTLVAFKRADNSWHGHKPFDGPRRVIQFNWVTSKGNQRLSNFRHQLSALVKKVLSPFRGAKGGNGHGAGAGDSRHEDAVGAGKM